MRKTDRSLKSLYGYMISPLNQLPGWAGFKLLDTVYCLRLASFLYYTVWFLLLRCSVLSGNVGCQSRGG
jgi:hypothetical protein